MMEQLRRKAVAHYDLKRQRGDGHKIARLSAARLADVSTRTIDRWRARYADDKVSSN